MTGIYKITNTMTNQCYIGQSVDIETRWRQHISNGKHLYYKTNFSLALNQYGAEAFEFEILEECPLEQEILDERERYWIEYYDSFKNGYNSTLGGQSENSWIYDPQVIRDLWDEGYSTGEIVEIVGCSCGTVQSRLRGYSDYNFSACLSRGRQYSIAEGSSSSIAVYQYDLNGQYIAEYKSINEASRELGHSGLGSHISDVLKHKRRTAFGYQWSKEKVDSMPVVSMSRAKLIKCMNTEQVFHSLKEAADWCNLKSCSGISLCCTGERKTAGKHPETGEKLKWEYVE